MSGTWNPAVDVERGENRRGADPEPPTTDEPLAEPIEIVEVTPDAIAVDGADDEPAEGDDA
ncbi:MAG TPA: hypothetical protein VEW95_09245 [Candidatus Limnocylindrales bacterium]|nr:hypothetical protein [Candidatus Limnocylindrales bacterium]